MQKYAAHTKRRRITKSSPEVCSDLFTDQEGHKRWCDSNQINLGTSDKAAHYSGARDNSVQYSYGKTCVPHRRGVVFE